VIGNVLGPTRSLARHTDIGQIAPAACIFRASQAIAARGAGEEKLFVFPPQEFKLFRMSARRALVKRSTKETQISLKLNVDGAGKSTISTGIPFFDHMLALFAKHSVVDLNLRCKGDLDVDAHHTVEDCGIALGQAFAQALGNKAGLRRYGTGFNTDPGVNGSCNDVKGEAFVPMDECLARCVIDFSGRPYLVWRGLDGLAYKELSRREKRQDMSCAFRFGLAREFFQGFTNEARCNLHLELLYGDEPHHIVEALFKAFAKATDFACQKDPRIAGQIPSTKGKL
jgi:imidazoleglycerol-phosphate dehydratase